jgi:hypothetical protein
MTIDGIAMTAEGMRTRNGFAHVATAILEDGRIVRNRVNYLNRTWECYRFQTALHGLCYKVAAEKFGAPSLRSMDAKKWTAAREYANYLATECDKHMAA